jgi:hypothetical protein
MREIKLQDMKIEIADRTRGLAEEDEVETAHPVYPVVILAALRRP